MRKRWFVLFLISVFFSACSQEKDKSNTVLICDSPDAYAYHNHQCHGLSSCNSQIINISVEEAIKMERRKCGYCY